MNALGYDIRLRRGHGGCWMATRLSFGGYRLPVDAVQSSRVISKRPVISSSISWKGWPQYEGSQLQRRSCRWPPRAPTKKTCPQRGRPLYGHQHPAGWCASLLQKRRFTPLSSPVDGVGRTAATTSPIGTRKEPRWHPAITGVDKEMARSRYWTEPPPSKGSSRISTCPPTSTFRCSAGRSIGSHPAVYFRP